MDVFRVGKAVPSRHGRAGGLSLGVIYILFKK